MTTVLVIDDNEDIRYTISEICAFSGWNVIEAKTGKEGVNQFKREHIDIVLVDYHMPNWDGLKTVSELRKVDGLAPIIVLTVDERQEVADRFLNAGATDFALKPIKAPDLISRIHLNLKVARLQKDQSDVYVDKGIRPETLNFIKNNLNKDEPLTIDEIQKTLPFAYQTVHRYLNYLVENGDAEVISLYGKVGRPKNKYRLIK